MEEKRTRLSQPVVALGRVAEEMPEGAGAKRARGSVAQGTGEVAARRPTLIME
jgi:hypothetical protein